MIKSILACIAGLGSMIVIWPPEVDHNYSIEQRMLSYFKTAGIYIQYGMDTISVEHEIDINSLEENS